MDLRGTVLNWRHVQEIFTAIASAEKFCFRSCTFTGNTLFPGARLKVETPPPPQRGELMPSGVVDFGEATFEGGADFRGAEFPGPVFFDDASFAGPLFLERAHFYDQAWFLRTTMTEGHFAETTFDRLAGFHSVRATTNLSFTGAEFSGRTDFDAVSAETIDFTEAIFSKRAAMLLDGPGVFTGTQFDGGLELRLTRQRGTATLRRTHFGASSTVAAAGFQHRRDATFRSANTRAARVPSLQDTDVENLSLVSVDLRDCLFAGALNLDKISLSGQIAFAQFPPGWRHPGWFRRRLTWVSRGRWTRRNLIREDLFWRIKGPVSSHELNGNKSDARKLWLAAGLPPDQPTPLATQVPDGPHLASLYRSLRKALEDAKNEPGAGDFYYGEMDVRRRASPYFSADRWLLTLYWILSGYGQRASRAVIALGVLLGTLTVLLTGYGLADTAPIQRITDAAQATTATPSPQVITIDITGQRATVTIPPASQPVAFDVSTIAPELPPADQRWTATRGHRAVRTLVTLLAPITTTEQRLTPTGTYLVLAGRVLGAILLGLALLAIRARVKR